MLRRLPLRAGAVAGLAALLLLGPVALAVALLRSSPDAEGPALAAQLSIAVIVVAIVALAALAGWGLARLALHLLRRSR